MSTFNAQNASVYGFTAEEFNNIFSNSSGDTPGITSLSNSFATVYPFTGSTQTAANAQAIEDLFPAINFGSNSYFNLNPAQVSGFYQNQQALYQYPENTSNFGVFSSTDSIQITPSGNATANLSNSTNTSNLSVAEGQLQFTFIPGSTQSLAVAYQTGTSISNAVANGITNTTTTGTTTTVTTGVTFTGLFPGATAQVNDSAQQAWMQQEQQQISYTTTQTNTVNTNVTTTVTVNINTATQNSSGQYIYTNSNGQSFTLVPGQQYIAEVLIDQCSYSTPVPNTFEITGPNMTLPMRLGVTVITQLIPGAPIVPGGAGTISNPINPNLPITNNVEQSIKIANSLGYSAYSGVDQSLFTYTQSPIATVTYSGLISSSTTTGTYSTIDILPVATSNDAQPSTSSTSNSLHALSNNISAMINSGESSNVSKLDLGLAAKNLSSSYGVFYDNTKSESLLHASLVDLIGGDHDYVKLGNLNYNCSSFSNSQIETGSGYNRFTLSSADNNNSILMGNGNNSITINGNGNNIKLGNGYNNVEVAGGTGKNYMVAGNGPIALTFTDSSGFTQISNWDNAQDFMQFKGNINLKDVHVTFDVKNWSYNVYVADKLIANLITNGGLSYADAASVVSPSIYAAPLPYNLKSNAGFLNGLYVDAFNAAPDSAGISYWKQQLDSGLSRNAVIQYFFTSDQFNIQNPSNSQYVNSLYEDLLGRPADTAGLSYWTKMLDGGQSKIAFIGSMLNSAEFNHLVGHG